MSREAEPAGEKLKYLPIWKFLPAATLFATRLKIPWICTIFYLA